ncbi:hypothetical protein [Paenibacillus sp. OSY-SE]|uniref:hypothetical protein n=1 Tax=Paenibacillus sp. OSY-SE TaxID=1196323 RepID=UPI0002E5D570|nr:hypothetical protein [Paenibacillus sp. OSY-SE]
MPYEAKTDWKYDDTVTEKDLNRIEQGLKDAHVAEHEALTLSPGVQLVEVENDTPFNFGEVKGRTLIDLTAGLGNIKDSNGDGIADGWVKSVNVTGTPTVESKFGMIWQVIPSVQTDTAIQRYMGFRLKRALPKDKKHVLFVDYFAEGDITAQVYFAYAQSGKTKLLGTVANSTRKTLYSPIDVTEDVASIYFYNASPVGTINKAYVSTAFVVEVPEDIYTKILNGDPEWSGEKLAAKYPYVDGMTNVRNPYTIVRGGNQLPPFTEWEARSESTQEFISPYEVQHTMQRAGRYLGTAVKVVPGQKYSLSVSEITDYARIRICVNDGPSYDNGTYIADLHSKIKNQSITIPNNVSEIALVLTNMPNIPSYPLVCTCADITMNAGGVTAPFAPQQRSMWAAECDLAANPVDGSNPDVLFQGVDGLPYVSKSWGKVTLDGSLPWGIPEVQNSGFKILFARDAAPNNASPGDWDDEGKIFAIKYDGKPMLGDDSGIGLWQKSDLVRLFTSSVYVSVSNTDSGWGDAYTPSADEIKAYFMGWKMYDNINPSNPHTPGAGKAWVKLTCRNADGTWTTKTPDARTTVPTEPAGSDTNGRVYTPYRLQYLKAQATAEPVRNYELGARLCKGANMVEVGSGIVLREKANPIYGGSGFYYVNTLSIINNPFKHKIKSIRMIYANQNEAKSKWIIDGVDAYGNERAKCLPENFDPTAVYHVTYTMLDPTLVAPISGTIAANLRGTVSDLVQHTGDMERRLSVVETQKAEKDVSAPEWIDGTPLNGWRPHEDQAYRSLSYRKMGNRLEIMWSLKPGTWEQTVIRLSPEYCVKRVVERPVIGWTSSGSVVVTATYTPKGELSFYATLGTTKADIGTVRGYLYLPLD